MDTTELIRDFVNTLHKDPQGDEEQLTSARALACWLHEHGLLERPRAGASELSRALELREALRTLLLANNEVLVDTRAAYAVLDQAARRGRVSLRFVDGAPLLLAGAPGVAGALGSIAAAVQGAVADGTWPRLKACRARDCEWAFLDRAKNASRAWCSMRACGNREKARLYRSRHAHNG